MDHETFEQELSTMSLFPEAVHAYARDVSKDMSTAERANLIGQLKDIYAEYESNEGELEEAGKKAIAELAELRKQALPMVHREVEAAERDGSLTSLEDEMSK